MKIVKNLAVLAALGMAVSPTFAAEKAPLPAGKPAGTHQAALLAIGPIFWIGLAAIGLGIGLASSNNNSKPTTTATGTSA